MKYTGPIFRPPPEAYTPLLQVTVGCAHNTCNYCTMYRSVQFTTERMEQIENDIRELSQVYGKGLKRIFLLNGDAFVLSAPKLIAISNLLQSYFPRLEVISMYASVRNIMSKTDDELKMLMEAKVNDLYIGIETGHAEVLQGMNKGYGIKDVYAHVPRLRNAGIRFFAAMMLGTGGRGMAREVAVETARLLDHIKPYAAGYTTMGIFEGSELSEKHRRGEFVTATEREVIEELIHVIESVRAEGITIENGHRLNMIQVKGTLPKDRQVMVSHLQNALEQYDDAILDQTIPRHSL